MIGFLTPLPAPFGLVNGDTLILKINNQTSQTITFTSDMNATDLIAFLNNVLIGATAYIASGTQQIIIRSNMRVSPGYIDIIGGTARSKMGIVNKTISERSDVQLVGTIPFGTVSFTDNDGVLEDFYGVSTIDNLGTESIISNLRQAINFSGPICVVEGCIIDLQGRRVADVSVKARIVSPPTHGGGHSFVTTKEVSTLTGEDGRFSLPLLQTARVIFEINDTKVCDPIAIPELPYTFFDDLGIDYKYMFEDRSY
jgi:hypothetical protein